MAATPPMPGIRRSIRMTSGRSALGQRQRLRAVRRLADHLEVRVAGEHPAQAVADDRVVVDDQQPDRAHDAADRRAEPAAIAGTRAETAVPPPGSDSIASGRRPGPPAGACRQPEPGRRPPDAALGHREARPRRRARPASPTSPM